jgi:hypothetical protein
MSDTPTDPPQRQWIFYDTLWSIIQGDIPALLEQLRKLRDACS